VEETTWREVRVPPDDTRPVYGSEACEIDLARRELRVLGSHVPIGGRAFEIIGVLAGSAGQLVTKDELLDRVWPGAIVGENTLHVHAGAIRKALGPYRNLLKTESGRGYRLLGDWSVRRHEAAGPPVGPQRMRVDGESPVTNFAVTVTRLVGRRAAVARLRDLVSAYRLVTLTGPGGIGKTSLALKVARGLVGEFTDGGWLVELASLSDPALMPAAAAAVLKLPIGPTSATSEAVARSIGHQKLLLVLDNCEHLIGAVAMLAETLLALCPHTTIITTSRETLRIQGEHVYRVSPLEVPAPGRDEADHILSHSAVELFIARTKALDTDFSPRAGELPSIGAICRHLDGIPLAIEFAAAHASTFGIQPLVARLHDRFALLTGGRRTAMPQHRTLRAVLDWSYELLSEGEQHLLRHLAMFSGGFTVDSAAAVVNDGVLDQSSVMEGISNLVAKSLVALDRDVSSRWYLLETIQTYGLEELTRHGETDCAARRHAGYFRDLFMPPSSSLNMRLSDTDLISRIREIDNVRAALDWSFSPVGDMDIGRDLTAAYVLVWLHRELSNECRERCEHALLDLQPDGRQNMWRRMLLQIALATALYASAGASERAETLAAEAFEAAEILDDFDTQVWALATLFSLHIGCRDYGAARKDAEQLRRIGDLVGDRAIVATADRRMGYLQYIGGRLREARQNFERALGFRFALDDRQPAFWSFPFHHTSMARGTLAEILCLRGFPEQALNEARANLDELSAMDHQLSSIHRLLTWGTCRIAILTGDLVTADREIAGLIGLSTSLNAPFWQATGRILAGKVMVERRAFADALSTLRGDFDASSQSPRFFPDQEVSGAFVEALAGLGQFQEALVAVDNAIASASQPAAAAWGLPELLRIKGEVLLQQAVEGSIPVAEDCFRQAGEMAREQGALFWELRIAYSFAGLRVAQKRREEAIGILRPVLEQFTEGFATKDLRAAKAFLDELRG
jgi:predicted ATPase/DNA-binding winged helix-turn-helix (wHTH) protein